MVLVDDLTSKVQEFARERWEAIPDGYVVPSADSLTFGNTGGHLDATVLYAYPIRATDKAIQRPAIVSAAKGYAMFADIRDFFPPRA
jgi:hypothetical protein